MRTLITVAALGAALWLLAERSGTGPAKPGSPEAGMPQSAVDWDEAREWVVLCPRGSGSSPAPLIAFATPGWLGPAEVTIETPRARTVSTTSNRSLPWPESLGPLEVGEWCAVSVSGPLGTAASAAFLRCAPVPELPHSATMTRARGR